MTEPGQIDPRGEPPGDTPRLRRSLSLPLITLYGLGTTVGAGIYALIGKVVGRAELFAPLSFLVAAALASLTALSFAELSARYPKSAGEAVYVREGLRLPSVSLVVGLLVALTGVVSAAAITLGAAGYVREFVDVPRGVVVVGLVLLIGGVAAWGIRESVSAAAVLTLVEIGGLLLVIRSGASCAPDLVSVLPDMVTPVMPGAWHGILAGSLLAFYAFIGFEDMVNVAEEVRDVRRNLPRAIVLTLLVTTLLYVVLAAVAVAALPIAELAASEAPLATLYACGGEASPHLISVIAIFATLNGAMIQIIMASRVLYGLGSQGALPGPFGAINATTRTPLVSTGLVTAAILSLALWLPLETLAEVTSVVVLIVFALANLSLCLIKRRGLHPAGVWRVWAVVPAVGFVCSLVFVAFGLQRLLLA